MEIVIWLAGIGLPVAALLYLSGWLVGFNAGCDMNNWGKGYEDGWKAYKELLIETRMTDNGFDNPGSGD